VVGDHNDLSATNTTNRRHHSCRWRRSNLSFDLLTAFCLLPAAFCSVLVPGNQQTYFPSITVFVQQQIDPFPRRQLSLLMLLFNPLEPATLPELRFELAQLCNQLMQTRSFSLTVKRLRCQRTVFGLWLTVFCFWLRRRSH